MDDELLQKYEYYLHVITEEISKMFEYQKEYICCQNGCSLCCEQGMYPFSELEFKYIEKAFRALPEETKQKVIEHIHRAEKEWIANNKEHFMHQCPFLINGSCSVYSHRGIICRTFGLITENSEGKLTLPDCATKGKNYSKVYDVNQRMILAENVEKGGYKVEPKAYNLSRKNMMALSFVKSLGIDFGETKMLVEWLFDMLKKEEA